MAAAADPKRAKIDLKIILLGSSGVGKTSLINRYIKDEFGDTVSTIGASFALKAWRNFKLGVWDTAGQEKYSALGGFYSRGAGAAVIVYDVTSRQSFEELERYIKLLENAEPGCFVVLVASKVDLVPPAGSIAREISAEEGRKFATDKGYAFFETSAKTGLNVLAVFDAIGVHCLGHLLPSSPGSGSGTSYAASSLAAIDSESKSRSNLNVIGASESKDGAASGSCCS